MSYPNLPFIADSAIAADAKPDLARLKGKSVVVTGGTSGIGEAITRAFVAAGAFVTIGDVADDRGAALVAELGPENAAFVHCDVLVWAEQVALFKTAIARAPARAVDIVCANAGIGMTDDLFPSEAEQADPDAEPVEPKLNTLRVNLLGMAYTAKLAMHYLPRQPKGDEANRERSFILTASMAGYLDQPGAPQYNSSKWGTRGLFRSFRNTMPSLGIRVGLIAPWYVRWAEPETYSGRRIQENKTADRLLLLCASLGSSARASYLS